MSLHSITYIFFFASAVMVFGGCGQSEHFSASGSLLNGTTQIPSSPLPVPPPLPSNGPNLNVCSQTPALPGTDVSDYDPGTQWTTVKHGGVGFAFIKATEGATFVNSLFSGDWSASQEAGVIRGAYHFFHPSDDPTSQANFFLNTIGTLNANDLPPMLDWEVTDGESNAVQIENAIIWLTVVEAATGKVPIIYVDPSFWNALGNPQGFQRYPLFIANYNVNCPAIPPPWSNWVFWQTGIGPVTGVASTQADQDVFNGSLAQLQTFALNGTTP